MARHEPGTYAYEYDGPVCPWCGAREDDERCGCPMALAAREDEYTGPPDGDEWSGGFVENH